MRLHAVRLRHVKGIREARYEGLSPGLNLFYGPNESGKSTLVEALRFGLFERAAGEAESKRMLRSWGETGTPEVEIELVLDDGTEAFVHKRFLDQPATELSLGPLVLRGEAAESRLRELLGTRPGNKYGVTQADLGVWPLLWARQGEAELAPADVLNDDARQRLSATLSARTGLAAAGLQGAAVLDAAQAEAERWWTPGGQPKAPLKRLLDAAEQADRDVADLEERKAAVDALAQRVAALADEVTALDARRRRQAERADAAHARATRADAARAELALATQTLALRRAHADAATAARVAHEVATHAATEAEADLDRARGEVERRRAKADALDADRLQLRQERAAAEARGAVAQAASRAAERARERATWQREADALQARLNAVSDVERRLIATMAERDRGRLPDADPARLDELAATYERSRALAEATSAHITVRALRPLTVDGRPVERGEAVHRLASAPLTVTLDDLAELVIAPGASEAQDHARDAERALAALTHAAARLGVPPGPPADLIAAVRARLDATRQADLALRGLRQELDLLAPSGAAPLHAELATLRAQLAAPGPADADAAGLDALRAAEDDARAVLASLQGRLDALDAPHRKATDAHAEARARAAAAEREAQRAASTLGALPPRAALEELDAAERVVERANQAWAAQGGEAAARDHATERKALDVLTQRHTEAQVERAAREAELGHRMAEGLAEALDDARAAATEARRALQAAQRRADAAAASWGALSAARQRMQDRFAGPVREAVSRHIGALFPGAALHVDPARGDVSGLVTRHGAREIVETFDVLSIGAREQLGVLVRLGIASVLAGDRRLPVVLDDALVNTDDDRRRAMIDVLCEASERLQLLVFTCHEADYDRAAADRQFRVAGRGPRRP